MKAGRELDALVAEKVMGWQWWNNGNRSNLTNEPQTFESFGWKPGKLPVHGTLEDSSGCPPYSGNIAAAWQVRKRLIELGWEVSIVPTDHFYTKQEYPETIRLHFPGPPTRNIRDVRCKTVEHGLCLAALKAVGVEVPNATS